MQPGSVRRKLFLAIFGPSVGILLLAAIGGLWMDVYALRRSIEHDARIQAGILGLALRGPLTVEIDPLLNELLGSLKGDPDITYGVVFSGETNRVAAYKRDRDVKLPDRAAEERSEQSFSVVHPIRMGDERIGTILLGVSLERYYSRLKWYIWAAVAAVVVLTLVAAWVANRLGQGLSEPLRQLTETAETISTKRDYAVRAPAMQGAEFQSLARAFNHMLEEIQGQTGALTVANQELKRANTELEAFTYSVSHDLRTPLRAISGYSQVVRGISEQLPEEAVAYLERIESNAIRMAELIDDLLAFSRVDACPLRHQSVNLDELVEEVWNELRAQNKGREIEFKKGALGTVEADRSLLRQVWTNLLGNAVKYTKGRNPAKIEVAATVARGQRAYCVRDNGAGFEPQYASKLFRVFQRLHSPKDFDGHGVGLAIVQRIVARHGGQVWAEGEPERGATFWFTLGQYDG